MQLLRIGPAGEETPAVRWPTPDGTFQFLDLTSIIDDITPAVLSPEGLRSLQEQITARRDELGQLDPSGRIGPPVNGVGKIVCVGLNYRKHAVEAGMDVPAEPVLFMKAADTIVGPDDDVIIPRASTKTDYEVELAVVIGTQASYLDASESALRYIAGYAISNDVSEREFQLERGGQWDKGKNAATFNPLGPLLVTADEIADPQQLQLSTSVNGEVRQDSSTADMIFTVDYLVRYISQFMTLYPGDIINTGTPEGVGSGFHPGRFLTPGDRVEVSISSLGTQQQEFREYQAGAR